jgi:hypothetical protein
LATVVIGKGECDLTICVVCQYGNTSAGGARKRAGRGNQHYRCQYAENYHCLARNTKKPKDAYYRPLYMNATKVFAELATPSCILPG